MTTPGQPQAQHAPESEKTSRCSTLKKWASLAWLDGKNYPAEEITEDAGRNGSLPTNSTNLAAGSGIGVIYKDAQKDYQT